MTTPTSMDPYYLLMKLPGESPRESFQLMVPFTPGARTT